MWQHRDRRAEGGPRGHASPVWANPNEFLEAIECTNDLADLMADPTFMVNEGGAVDESDGDVTFDVQAVLLGGGCAGTWYRQWTATDECGNVSYAEQFIPVVDETAPEFLFFPEDVTLSWTPAATPTTLQKRWAGCLWLSTIAPTTPRI